MIVGIDNGVSGSIGIISEKETVFFPTPVFTGQNYVKKRQNISRLDRSFFKRALTTAILKNEGENEIVIFERPLVNPARFFATESALRCLEAELSIVEDLCMPYIFIDSKEWQRKVLPQGTKGEDLKKMSKEIGTRLFPQFKEEINKHKDADGLLIAYWYKEKYWLKYKEIK